jgi:hypothetical protein
MCDIIKPPLIRLVREGTVGNCQCCGSSELLKYEWFFFSFGEKIGCIQSKCENYYLIDWRVRDKKLKKLVL